MYRLFTAVDLPGTIAGQLGAMSFGIPGARWVPEEQLHLTLRFIGEVDGGLFRDIREALADVRGKEFVLRLKGFGCFPPRRQPRVLWVGVDPAAGIVALRNKVESVLVRQGLEPEQRKFFPHITLARLKDSPLQKVSRFLAGNGLFVSESFSVSEFRLYSSVLTPKGAVHQLEAAYPLSG